MIRIKLHPREVQICTFNNLQSNDEMPIIAECNQMLFVASLFFCKFPVFLSCYCKVQGFGMLGNEFETESGLQNCLAQIAFHQSIILIFR